MSDILSQEEIDRLLQAVASGQISVEEIKKEEEKKKVKLYDFKRPSKFSKEHIRVFDMIHENFARALSTYLSGRVRTFANVTLASIDQVPYEEFVRSLPSPSFIVVFSAPEFVGSGVFEMNLELFYTILDLILGGPGIPAVKRTPSDIEISIMRKEVMNMLTTLAQAWSEIYNFSPSIESIENNPLFVQIAPATEMVLLVSLVTTVGKTEGFINICWPSSLVEPFLDKLTSRMWFAAKRPEKVGEFSKELKSNVMNMKVTVSAVLGQAILNVGEILDLEVGDVIRLDTHVGDDITVYVQDKPKFTAQPGVYKDRKAVKITGLISQEVEFHEQQ
ncbi:flagellar motor switch protein FliM [Pseudothermotoga thermarum]|uniref:Flagellar motor switch protein FliM n=1 Tax=Pseudothermotoga thermarum DSM 5069 TaxID=688269 RepID=F7YW71_9THEM|nr:flagellar motor switch protein FliM [Pseudothermotoga thermarum]AEH51843.1 flagellar motor switch protein FliM [Pseudothermotoga thermarum DSM 5069]